MRCVKWWQILFVVLVLLAVSEPIVDFILLQVSEGADEDIGILQLLSQARDFLINPRDKDRYSHVVSDSPKKGLHGPSMDLGSEENGFNGTSQVTFSSTESEGLTEGTTTGSSNEPFADEIAEKEELGVDDIAGSGSDPVIQDKTNTNSGGSASNTALTEAIHRNVINKARLDPATLVNADVQKEQALRVVRHKLTFYVSVASRGGYKAWYGYFVGLMLESKGVHEKTGITMSRINDRFKADIVVCHAAKAKFPSSCEKLLQEAEEKGFRKFRLLIYVEQSDTGSLTTQIPTILRSDTLAVIKPFAWKYHQRSCDGTAFGIGQNRRHFHLIQALVSHEGPVQTLPPGPLTIDVADKLIEHSCPPRDPAEISGKIVVGIPFTLTAKEGEQMYKEKLTPPSKRTIDVVFVGAMWAKDPALDAHRGGLVKEMKKIQARHPKWNMIIGGYFRGSKYLETLRNAKIFISPFGAGEWSIKDEQIAFAGAVLLKPAAALLEATVGIYQPDVTCIDVRPDWVGLEETLVKALSDLSNLERIQRNAHNEAARFRSEKQSVNQKDVIEKYAILVKRAASMAG